MRRVLCSTEPLLLQSITSSKSHIVLSRMFPAHTQIATLIDSGCSPKAFCDAQFVQDHDIETYDTPYPRTLLLGDGRAAMLRER